jgi:hypothetical protein
MFLEKGISRWRILEKDAFIPVTIGNIRGQMSMKTNESINDEEFVFDSDEYYRLVCVDYGRNTVVCEAAFKEVIDKAKKHLEDQFSTHESHKNPYEIWYSKNRQFWSKIS